jgi:AcrR family transcriptional regulator
VTEPRTTRQRIFEAAVEEFAAYGNAGARVDRIADKAQANKEAIYRYFGTKEELLRRVLDLYLDERGEQLLPQSQDLDAYAAGLFTYHLDNPEFLRLTMWEALEMGGLGPGSPDQGSPDQGSPDQGSAAHRRAHYQEKVASVRAQQEDGKIDPGLDPRHLIVAILGLANVWHMMPQMVRLVFGAEPDEETIARQEEFVAECVRRIIAPRG